MYDLTPKIECLIIGKECSQIITKMKNLQSQVKIIKLKNSNPKLNKSEIKRLILVIRIIQSENFLETKNPKVSNVKSNGPQHRK